MAESISTSACLVRQTGRHPRGVSLAGLCVDLLAIAALEVNDGPRPRGAVRRCVPLRLWYGVALDGHRDGRGREKEAPMQVTTLEHSDRDTPTASIVARRPARRRLAVSRTFYLAASVLLLAAVVIGFWPTYFGRLLAGTPLPLRPMVKVHAPVFLGWMVLLLAQTALVVAGRVDLHRKLGWVGVGYAAVAVVVGLLLAADGFSARVASGDVRSAYRFLLVPGPINDMILFGGFFSAAIVYRKKPQIHKRLIVVSAIVLAGPGLARLPFATTIPLTITVAFAPFLLAMAFDVVTRRRVHPVYVIGFGIDVLSLARAPLSESDAWINFSMWVHRLLFT
jgi:hypothetical protein